MSCNMYGEEMMFSRQKSLDIRRDVVLLPRACSFSGTCSVVGANASSSAASWEATQQYNNSASVLFWKF